MRVPFVIKQVAMVGSGSTAEAYLLPYIIIATTPRLNNSLHIGCYYPLPPVLRAHPGAVLYFGYMEPEPAFLNYTLTALNQAFEDKKRDTNLSR